MGNSANVMFIYDFIKHNKVEKNELLIQPYVRLHNLNKFIILKGLNRVTLH